MAKVRRAFGSVTELPSGHWQARWRRGGQHYTAERTFRTKSDARQYLSTVEADLLRGQFVDTRPGLASFGDYAEAWLKRRSDDPRRALAPTTRAKYRRLLDAYLLPEFADRKLTRITPEQIRSWNDIVAKEHLSTAADAYRLLATVFNAAVRDRAVPRSPCDLEGASRARSAERPTASPAQIQAALEVAPEKSRLAIMLAAWCQLRRGEILGLQRGDVDLENGTVTVRRAWLVTSEGKTVVGPPKSEAGRRTVYMPSNVLEVMTRHLDAYTDERSDAWLFERNGAPVQPRNLERWWMRGREAAGIGPLRFHDLRHSGLTWAAQTGATTAELMRQAGHSSPTAAARYQHAADQRAKELAAKLGEMAPTVSEGGR